MSEHNAPICLDFKKVNPQGYKFMLGGRILGRKSAYLWLMEKERRNNYDIGGICSRKTQKTRKGK